MKFVALVIAVLLLISMAAAEHHEWAVELHPSVNADELAQRHGFENVGLIGAIPNHYLFRLKPANHDNAEHHANNLRNAEGVTWAEKQVPKKMVNKPHPAGRVRDNL